MFYDLNIAYDPDDLSSIADVLNTSTSYGFGCVALNWTSKTAGKDDINTVRLVELGKRSTNSATISSASSSSATSGSDLSTSKGSTKSLLQLKRVTIDMTEDAQIQTISPNNSHLSAFDIVAVQPATEKLLLSAVQSTEIDLITFDATKRLTYRIRTAVVRQAVGNGIMFEICLNDALRDPSARKNAVSNAKRIIEATKGKNIIITSGASEPLLLRGPYDLINLAHFFGLEAAAARKCLVQNPRALVLHALTRKTHRGVVDMHHIADLDRYLQWTTQERAELSLDKQEPTKSSKKQSSAMDVVDDSEEAAPASLSSHSDPKKTKGKRKRVE